MNDSSAETDEYCNNPSCVACTIAKFEIKLTQEAHKIDYRITQPQLEAAFRTLYCKELAN